MLVHDALIPHLAVKLSVRAEVKKSKLDLAVLKYMTRRLHFLLRQLGQPLSTAQPSLYLLEERHKRTHRITIYKQQELLLRSSFLFVGFVSRKHKDALPSVSDDIVQADKQLIQEFVHNPAILSYSSLEFRNGDWCNLVVMSGPEAKSDIKSSATHAYAAHQLAQHYYEWIRLHNGIMPEGLDHTEMQLLKTKYYTFPTIHTPPIIQEHVLCGRS